MGFKLFLMVSLAVCSSMVYVQAASSNGSSIPAPAPAPAPAPDFINLTELLTVAGPFSIFLRYLKETKVIDMFQNQANNSKYGITVFVPKDSAFSSQKSPSLSNLTSHQLMQLCMFHALPNFYSLASFKNLSLANPVSTFAGSGSYGLNFTDDSGTVLISSGLTKTKVSSSVHSTDPVALYQVDNVLLSEAIFGSEIPTVAAPAPAPSGNGPVADSPATTITTSNNGKHKNSSFRSASWSFMSQLGLAISGLIMVLL